MEHNELTLLRDSVEQVLTAADPSSWSTALEEFGWHDLLRQEARTALGLVADLQGRLLPHSSIVNDAVSLVPEFNHAITFPQEGVLRFVFPDLGSMRPPATVGPDATTLTVSGMMSLDPRPSGRLVIPAADGSRDVIVTVDDPDMLSYAPAAIDPDSGWVHVSGTATATVVAADTDAHRLRDQAIRNARLVLAGELTSLGRCMLDLTVQHVTSRKQFGRALGSFQSVKHGLADTRVAQEVAELAIETGWDRSDPEAAVLSKLLANNYFRSAAENCQQYLGGMGFTWEHPFHTFLRRGLILEQLLGTTSTLRAELGAVLRNRAMPVIGVL